MYIDTKMYSCVSCLQELVISLNLDFLDYVYLCGLDSVRWINKGLYLNLNEQVYNINYNTHIQETRLWCAERCLATEKCG